jgi:hypothetical protein
LVPVDGSIEEYQDKVVGFSQKERIDLDDILAPITRGFSQKEGVDHVEGFASVVEGFEVHGPDTHVYSLLDALCGLLFAPQAWYFSMDETCANF